MPAHDEPISAPPEVLSRVSSIVSRATPALYGQLSKGQSLLETLLQKASTNSEEVRAKASSQGEDTGIMPHPFDMETAAQILTLNEYHAACINTKVSCTVGLGFVLDAAEGSSDAAQGTKNIRPSSKRQVSKADKVLNPLCDVSFNEILCRSVEDYWSIANGYIEVKRNGSEDNAPIVGLYWQQGKHVFVEIEDEYCNRHYKVCDKKYGDRIFARFGDRARLLQDMPQLDAEQTSELIAFPRPNSISRWYGFPDWISSTACIELMSCLAQYKFDFFLNRGVPEFLLFLTGQKLPKNQWDQITNAIAANIGLGNSHKTMAVNLDNPNIKVQVEKLAMDAIGEDNFDTTKTNLALSIVSSHGVPPLLAGIQVPGKLGATNELPNALQGFQALKIGPAQRVIGQILANTLGNPKMNGGLGLTETDLELYTILDEIDLGSMDTMARMRETAPEAKAKGRDLSRGVKK